MTDKKEPGERKEGEIILNLKKLKSEVGKLKKLGKKIVLTQGTWDLVHIGHARYLSKAKSYGDVLVVGVDSDKKVKARKGPDRPIVPEDERMEMISHFSSVDFVTKKDLKKDSSFHLTKTICPDVLIAVEGTYKDGSKIKELEKYCGKVIILDPQATTSTSAKIRRLQISTTEKIEKILGPKIMKSIEETFSQIKDEPKRK